MCADKAKNDNKNNILILYCQTYNNTKIQRYENQST